MNDVPDQLEFANVSLYVDYTAMLVSSRPQVDLMHTLKSLLEKCNLTTCIYMRIFVSGSRIKYVGRRSLYKLM